MTSSPSPWKRSFLFSLPRHLSTHLSRSFSLALIQARNQRGAGYTPARQGLRVGVGHLWKGESPTVVSFRKPWGEGKNFCYSNVRGNAKLKSRADRMAQRVFVAQAGQPEFNSRVPQYKARTNLFIVLKSLYVPKKLNTPNTYTNQHCHDSHRLTLS